MDHDLIWVVRRGLVQDLQRLLPNAKIHEISEKGFSYIHYAICESTTTDKKAMVECLIAAGVDVNVGLKGQPPLFCAIRQNKPALVQMLIDAGADCLTFTMEGVNPIIYLETTRLHIERFNPSGIQSCYEIMKIMVIAITKTIGMAIAPLELPAYVVFWILEFVEPAVKKHERVVINILQKLREIHRRIARSPR